MAFLTHKTEMGSKEILNYLQEAENGRFKLNIITTPPVKARGGDLFMYRCSEPKDIDYLADQYRWKNKGGTQSRTSSPLIATYYATMIETGKNPITSNDFRKIIYVLRKPINDEHPCVLLFYIGDESIALPLPHGNSTKERPYSRTMPSTINKIKERLVSGQHPERVYENVQYDVKKEMNKKHNQMRRSMI